MPLELIVHHAGCKTRPSPCDCNPRVFDITQMEEALAAHGGDHSRLEIGRHTAPVHVNRVEVVNSQAARHRRSISE